jgi:hypothetical protein
VEREVEASLGSEGSHSRVQESRGQVLKTDKQKEKERRNIRFILNNKIFMLNGI